MIGLIVTNGFTRPSTTTYKIRRLKEEFFKINKTTLDVKSAIDIRFLLQDGNILVDPIKPYDFVIFLDKDKYLCQAIEKKVKTFNSAAAIAACDDKMQTHLLLANQSIKMPKTIPAPLNFSINPSPEYIEDFLDKIEKEFSYPLIAKECYGSLGNQVYLIKNRKELNNIYMKLHDKSHLYQELIKSSIGIDYRIIVIGDKVVASMKRVNKLDFRSNIALGGEGLNITPPKDYLDVAVKAAKILNLDYCGVDILIGSNGEPILNEVNSNAFFNGIEEVTKINVANEFAQYIINKISR